MSSFDGTTAILGAEQYVIGLQAFFYLLVASIAALLLSIFVLLIVAYTSSNTVRDTYYDPSIITSSLISTLAWALFPLITTFNAARNAAFTIAGLIGRNPIRAASIGILIIFTLLWSTFNVELDLIFAGMYTAPLVQKVKQVILYIVLSLRSFLITFQVWINFLTKRLPEATVSGLFFDFIGCGIDVVSAFFTNLALILPEIGIALNKWLDVDQSDIIRIFYVRPDLADFGIGVANLVGNLGQIFECVCGTVAFFFVPIFRGIAEGELGSDPAIPSSFALAVNASFGILFTLSTDLLRIPVAPSVKFVENNFVFDAEVWGAIQPNFNSSFDVAINLTESVTGIADDIVGQYYGQFGNFIIAVAQQTDNTETLRAIFGDEKVDTALHDEPIEIQDLYPAPPRIFTIISKAFWLGYPPVIQIPSLQQLWDFVRLGSFYTFPPTAPISYKLALDLVFTAVFNPQDLFATFEGQYRFYFLDLFDLLYTFVDCVCDIFDWVAGLVSLLADVIADEQNAQCISSGRPIDLVGICILKFIAATIELPCCIIRAAVLTILDSVIIVNKLIIGSIYTWVTRSIVTSSNTLTCTNPIPQISGWCEVPRQPAYLFDYASYLFGDRSNFFNKTVCPTSICNKHICTSNEDCESATYDSGAPICNLDYQRCFLNNDQCLDLSYGENALDTFPIDCIISNDTDTEQCFLSSCGGPQQGGNCISFSPLSYECDCECTENSYRRALLGLVKLVTCFGDFLVTALGDEAIPYRCFLTSIVRLFVELALIVIDFIIHLDEIIFGNYSFSEELDTDAIIQAATGVLYCFDAIIQGITGQSQSTSVGSLATTGEYLSDAWQCILNAILLVIHSTIDLISKFIDAVRNVRTLLIDDVIVWFISSVQATFELAGGIFNLLASIFSAASITPIADAFGAIGSFLCDNAQLYAIIIADILEILLTCLGAFILGFVNIIACLAAPSNADICGFEDSVDLILACFEEIGALILELLVLLFEQLLCLLAYVTCFFVSEPIIPGCLTDQECNDANVFCAIYDFFCSILGFDISEIREAFDCSMCEVSNFICQLQYAFCYLIVQLKIIEDILLGLCDGINDLFEAVSGTTPFSCDPFFENLASEIVSESCCDKTQSGNIYYHNSTNGNWCADPSFAFTVFVPGTPGIPDTPCYFVRYPGDGCFQYQPGVLECSESESCVPDTLPCPFPTTTDVNSSLINPNITRAELRLGLKNANITLGEIGQLAAQIDIAEGGRGSTEQIMPNITTEDMLSAAKPYMYVAGCYSNLLNATSNDMWPPYDVIHDMENVTRLYKVYLLACVNHVETLRKYHPYVNKVVYGRDRILEAGSYGLANIYTPESILWPVLFPLRMVLDTLAMTLVHVDKTGINNAASPIVQSARHPVQLTGGPVLQDMDEYRTTRLHSAILADLFAPTIGNSIQSTFNIIQAFVYARENNIERPQKRSARHIQQLASATAELTHELISRDIPRRLKTLFYDRTHELMDAAQVLIDDPTSPIITMTSALQHQFAPRQARPRIRSNPNEEVMTGQLSSQISVSQAIDQLSNKYIFNPATLYIDEIRANSTSVALGENVFASDECGTGIEVPFECCDDQLICLQCSFLDRLSYAIQDSFSGISEYYGGDYIGRFGRCLAEDARTIHRSRVSPERACPQDVCDLFECVRDDQCEESYNQAAFCYQPLGRCVLSDDTCMMNDGDACVVTSNDNETSSLGSCLAGTCPPATIVETFDTDCECLDTYLTVNKRVPPITSRFSTIQWPWLWNWTAALERISPNSDLLMTGEIPEDHQFRGDVRMRANCGNDDGDNMNCLILDLSSSISILPVPLEVFVEDAMYIISQVTLETGEDGALPNFLSHYVFCDYNDDYYCHLTNESDPDACGDLEEERRQGADGALFDGFIIMILFTGIAVLLARICIPILPVNFLVILLIGNIFTASTLAISYGGGLFCYTSSLLVIVLPLYVAAFSCLNGSCTAVCPDFLGKCCNITLIVVGILLAIFTLFPGNSVCFGDDLYSLSIGVVADCYPIDPELIDRSSPAANVPCIDIYTSNGDFLLQPFDNCFDPDTLETTQFVDGIDSILYYAQRACATFIPNALSFVGIGPFSFIQDRLPLHTEEAHQDPKAAVCARKSIWLIGRDIILLFVLAGILAALIGAFYLAVILILGIMLFPWYGIYLTQLQIDQIYYASQVEENEQEMLIQQAKLQ